MAVTTASIHLELDDARDRFGAVYAQLRLHFEHIQSRCPSRQRDTERIAESPGRAVQLAARPLLVLVEHDPAIIGSDASSDVNTMSRCRLIVVDLDRRSDLGVRRKLAQRGRR